MRMAQRLLTAILVVVLSVLLGGDLLVARAGDPAHLGGDPLRSISGVGSGPKDGPAKLGGDLQDLAYPGSSGSLRAMTDPTGNAQDGLVRVVLETEKDQTQAVIAAILGLGARFEISYQNMVQALVPPSDLPALASLAGVSHIRRPLVFEPAVVTSEGVSSTGAGTWLNGGFRGRGASVAIIDADFNGYEVRLGRELPGSVVFRSFRSDEKTGDGGGHGTAVAEIVHDMAPDAQLYLLAMQTDVELGHAIDFAISHKVDIISISGGFFNSGPGDGTGFVDNLVDEARAAGILPIIAAGNSAQSYWEGEWAGVPGSAWQEFAPGVIGNRIYIPAGEAATIYLSWNDWPASDQDYDLYLVDEDGAVVARSASVQDGDQPPTESLSYQPETGGHYFIGINRYSATRPVKFRLFSPQADLQYQIAAGSLSQPADSANVLAVGAVYYAADTIEAFSSQGPTQDGRIKPDLVAPDGVSTVTYGAADGAGDLRNGFYGTSASTPHISGAAALVAAAHPSFTPDQIQQALQEQAVDLGAPGKDDIYGGGELSLKGPLADVSATQPFASPAFEATWQRTDLPVISGLAQRTWIWGPVGFKAGQEAYAEAPAGTRVVEYFDKGRMEVSPDGVGGEKVTAGLLVRELIGGKIQTGDAQFQDVGSAEIPVAGDPPGEDEQVVTYASLSDLASLNTDRRAENRVGQVVFEDLSADGQVSQLATPPVSVPLVQYEETLGHNVPGVFVDFFEATGPVYDQGSYQTAAVVDWTQAFGLPISEPYWIKTRISGAEKDVLIQAFERSLITFTPDNPEGWRVELANVGRDYFQWRYAGVGHRAPTPPPPPESVPIPPPNLPPAQTNGASLSVSRSVSPAGSRFTFTGTGFQPGEKVGVWFTRPDQSVLGVDWQATADEFGAIRFSLDTSGRSQGGLWAASAEGVESHRSGTVYFWVLSWSGDGG